MDLFSLFGRTQPATVSTGRIIPLRYWDQLDYIRSLCHDFTLRFDDVLDASKLEAALGRLMEIGDWGQLGARLRLNDNQQLEYHIPAEYDQNRPAFNFTTTEYDISINEHPFGSRLPKTGSDQSSLLPSSRDFTPLVRHPDSPRELADWIYSDRPQLHIHVALFQDAALLTVSYVHTLFDAIARTNFFNAWIAVLRGREEEVPPICPFDTDPLRTLGKEAPMQNYSKFGRIVSGLGLLVFGIRYMFELLWFREEEEHPIRLPGRSVDQMTGTRWVSERNGIALSLKPAPDRTIMVMNVFNVWSLFNEWFPDGGAGFIGNVFFYSYTLLVASQILQATNLGNVAIKNRQALVEHRTKEQVQAMTAIQRASFMRAAPVVGDPNLLFMVCTNQQKAKFFETDFSAAVVAPGVPLSERPHALGRPSYINDIEHFRGYPTRNVVRDNWEDAAGDWWLLFKTRAGAWPVIHEQLMVL